MEFKKLIVGESFYNRLGARSRLCNQAARMSPRVAVRCRSQDLRRVFRKRAPVVAVTKSMT
jgi:hypothetical protein